MFSARVPFQTGPLIPNACPNRLQNSGLKRPALLGLELVLWTPGFPTCAEGPKSTQGLAVPAQTVDMVLYVAWESVGKPDSERYPCGPGAPERVRRVPRSPEGAFAERRFNEGKDGLSAQAVQPLIFRTRIRRNGLARSCDAKLLATRIPSPFRQGERDVSLLRR
jgi:hypothetical protein